MADIITGDAELSRVMVSPVISARKKENIIRKIAEKEGAGENLKNALMYLCQKRDIGSIDEICEALEEYSLKMNDVVSAVLYCVTEPDENQTEGIKKWLMKRFDKKAALIRVVKKPSLLGGFIIEAEGVRFDRSALSQLESIKENIKVRS